MSQHELGAAVQDEPTATQARDPEEIAEILGGADENPTEMVGALMDEGGEYERGADEVDSVLRELQRENDLLRQPEDASTAASSAELLQQLEQENLELRLENEAKQRQTSGGEQAVLVASLLAIVAKLEEGTRTNLPRPSSDAVPAPEDVSPSRRLESGKRVRRNRPGVVGSPIPLSNWSGAGGGVRRGSPHANHRRAVSPAKQDATGSVATVAAEVKDDEEISSKGRRTGSSRRRARRHRRRKAEERQKAVAAASRRGTRLRKIDRLAMSEAEGLDDTANLTQTTTHAGDSGVLAAAPVRPISSIHACVLAFAQVC